ncbi:MAG: glycyl-radical enzyme activating protein [Ruminococcaceae bacterium]|nr:glycyl-radical enzyme activating protein [Oscillospiraceae bacterium]
MTGRIFSIEEFAVFDGPGIRVNVFFKGCPLRCRWCHNPEGLSRDRQVVHSPNGCLSCGKCREVCPSPDSCILCGNCINACPRGLIRFAGDEWESDALAKRILRLKPILQNGGGVTFSGGEVLMQPEFLMEMLDKTAELHRAVETCGMGRTEDFTRMLDRVELVYFDLKVMDSEKHKFYTGVSNERILAHAKLLMQSGVPHIFRVPFIHGVNTGAENLQAMADFLADSPVKPQVEFLPYNEMAGAKYALAGMTYTESFEKPYPEDIERAKELLRDCTVSFRK